VTKLQDVFKLIVYIAAEDKDRIGITYFGLKGIKTNVKREQVVITTYESKPNLADHKVNLPSEAMHKFE
jgi:hypothetical protein